MFSDNYYSSAAHNGNELDLVLIKFSEAGYKQSKTTKKLIEYTLENGSIVYLIKTSLRLNNITVMVHPELKRGAIEALNGVANVNFEYRFHSNMNRFPKKFHNGKTETPYGWQVTLNGITSLSKFLNSFSTEILM